MNARTQFPPQEPVVYPDSDGQPIAENTHQLRYIMTIVGGLQAQYRDNPNVFVAGNLLWYPVEGDPTIRQAPDAIIAFNRPKGDRGSYRQWEEGGVAPQVVFEILSPGNRRGEMHAKWKFYERYGVEEYYLYDPDHGLLRGWLREGNDLVLTLFMDGWVSPRLGIRFQLVDKELVLYHPNGTPFATYVELAAQLERERAAKERAQEEAEQERERAEQEARKAARWLAKLKELGIDPEA